MEVREREAAAGHQRVRLTLRGTWRGAVEIVPIALFVLPFGIAFGAAAAAKAVPPGIAVLMSATVYSGSAQTATVSGMAAGAGIGASVVTILMLNARYLLYGAALRPWLGQASTLQAYSSLYLLGDGNWVLSMKAHASGESDTAFVFGSGVAMFIPWLGGTLLGSLVNEWVADPKMLGLDFLLVAFCTAMGVGLIKARRDWLPLGAAVVAAVVVDRFASSSWTIVAAGLAGALTAFARAKEPA